MSSPFKFSISDIAAGTLGMYRAKDGFSIRHPFTAEQMSVNRGDQFIIIGIEEGTREGDPMLLMFCHVQSRYKVCLTVDEFKSRLEPMFKV